MTDSLYGAVILLVVYKFSQLWRPDFINKTSGIINQTNELLTLLKRNGIPFYNFDEYIDKNFNENNISIVFKKVPNPKGYDHYTPYGNKILSEKIIEKLRLIN